MHTHGKLQKTPQDIKPQRVFTLRAALKCRVEWERVQRSMVVESPGGEEEQLSVESALLITAAEEEALNNTPCLEPAATVLRSHVCTFN